MVMGMVVVMVAATVVVGDKEGLVRARWVISLPCFLGSKLLLRQLVRGHYFIISSTAFRVRPYIFQLVHIPCKGEAAGFRNPHFTHIIVFNCGQKTLVHATGFCTASMNLGLP
jgi:hypothetical protein